MIEVAIYNKTRTLLSHKIFRDLLPSAERILIQERTINKKKHKIELSFIGDQKMQALNRYYHKKNRSTDVISLSYFEKNELDPFVGEIFISIPYAKKQAKKIHQSLHEELKFLFIHGLLHVFGYDHVRLTEEAHMKTLIYKILSRI